MTIITSNASVIKDVTVIVPNSEGELHYTCLDESGDPMQDYILLERVATIIP